MSLFLEKHSKLRCIEYPITPHVSKFVINALEERLCYTVGNVLRRVLMDFIPGYAVTQLRINSNTLKNVITNEFATIPGVQEDILTIISRIKNLSIAALNKQDDEKKDSGDKNIPNMTLHVEGREVVTSGLITDDGYYTVTDKDVVLFHVNKDIILDIDFIVEQGIGYTVVSHNQRKIVDNCINIDSLFSPVLQVRYEVDSNFVASKGNKLTTLTIMLETRPSITPKEAICQAFGIVNSLFTTLSDSINLVSYEEPVTQDNGMMLDNMFRSEEPTQTINKDDSVAYTDQQKQEILKRPIEFLELSMRVKHCLSSAGIETIEDVVNKSYNDIVAMRNFGNKSIKELVTKLDNYDLSLRDEP